MVEVAPGIRAKWRELEASGSDPRILLQFSSSLDQGAALEALRDAARHAIEALWTTDPAALWDVVNGGAQWCAGDADESALSLSASTLPRIEVERGQLEQALREALDVTARTGVTDLTSVERDRFRMLSIHPHNGRVSLIAGSPLMGRTGWRGPLGELIAVMRRIGERTVYGLVKRGSDLTAARFGDSLKHDWPPRAREIATAAKSFEDTYAPDAFGVQLLGPGYAARIPDAASWRRTRLGADRVLLEHVAPGAWFDASFAPFGGNWRFPGEAIPVPDVLVRARGDLAPIIFDDEVASER